LNQGIDKPSGSGDNSFGQGTKEDGSAVTVVSGSIPPNKSDLTRFYEASQLLNNQVFLYLAWERTNNLGNANMDFEINQSNNGCPNTPGSCTISRSNGDVLVTYDFSGSGTPTLGILRWLVAGKPSFSHSGNNVAGDCFSANTLPCWGDHQTLNSGDSEGQVDTGTSGTVDPIGPNAPRTIVQNGFGEAAINLTAAGVINPSNACSFGGATTFLKSRSSSSFTSEIKDFVAPISTPIVNQCAEVKIIKHTDPSGINQNFGFTSNLVGVGSSLSCTTDTTPASFTLNDSATNVEDCTGVAANSSGTPYTVTEGAEPSNFQLESLTCTATGSSTGSQDATDPMTADISLTPETIVTCTYVNQQLLGAIKITKTSTKGNAPLAGATFSITAPDNSTRSVTTGSDGTVCVDHLPFGDYSVQETAAPTGYQINDTTAHTVTVNANSTCGDGNEATFSATDTPLSKIGVSFNSKAGLGVTSATIQCTGDSSAQSLGDSGSTLSPPGRVLDNLTPGSYTCTVVIDP
jgi:hypothetical protein